MINPSLHRFDFFISRALWADLERAARVMEVSRTDLIRLAIRHFLRHEGFTVRAEADAEPAIDLKRRGAKKS